MKHAYLTRGTSTDQGTPGDLTTEIPGDIVANLFEAKTLELPWRDNKKRISCVLPGDFLCQWLPSPHFRRELYWLKDVPGRSSIELHPATWGGDEALGYLCNLRGCITLGQRIGVMNNQLAIFTSRLTVQKFEAFMEKQDFMLHIRWGPGHEPVPIVADLPGPPP